MDKKYYRVSVRRHDRRVLKKFPWSRPVVSIENDASFHAFEEIRLTAINTGLLLKVLNDAVKDGPDCLSDLDSLYFCLCAPENKPNFGSFEEIISDRLRKAERYINRPDLRDRRTRVLDRIYGRLMVRFALPLIVYIDEGSLVLDIRHQTFLYFKISTEDNGSSHEIGFFFDQWRLKHVVTEKCEGTGKKLLKLPDADNSIIVPRAKKSSAALKDAMRVFNEKARAL